MESDKSFSSSSTIVRRRRLQEMRIENPFAFKVLQVFTGFGVGCGVGIGVGKPINLGTLPMVGQVMSATRGATDAFSGASRHVNDALRKIGAHRIEVGIGCGVGFGHGIGIGLALKPGVVKKVQICLMEAVANLMTKFGVDPKLPTAQDTLPNPMSMQSEMSSFNGVPIQIPLGSISQLATKPPDQTFQGIQGYGYSNLYSSYGKSTSTSSQVDMPFGSRTEQVINSFLQNPVLSGDRTSNQYEEVECLRSENNLLQMVLKHQQVIEELVEENEKLRQILMEDLKVSPSKIQSSHSTDRSPCYDCFKCRRKQRKK